MHRRTNRIHDVNQTIQLRRLYAASVALQKCIAHSKCPKQALQDYIHEQRNREEDSSLPKKTDK